MAGQKRNSGNAKRNGVKKRITEKTAREITREMELSRPREACYINLILLKRLMDERCGGINATAKATGIRRSTLHRRMNGTTDFTFREMLRVAFVLRLTLEEFAEVFYAGYINHMEMHKETEDSQNRLAE